MKHLNFLSESIEPETIQSYIVEDTFGDKQLYFKSILSTDDVVNKNKRKYPSEVLREAMMPLVNRISTEGILCSLDHPPAEEAEDTLKNSCAKITKIYKEGHDWIGEFKVLRGTTMGNTLYTILSEGFKPGVSSRGYGELEENTDGTFTVKKGLKLITYDVVSNPSNYTSVIQMMAEKVYYENTNGLILEDVQATLKKKLDKVPQAQLKEGVVNIFSDFFSNELLKK